MTKGIEYTKTKDMESGLIRAYVIQKEIRKHPVSTKTRKAVRRRLFRTKMARALYTALKASYTVTVILAVLYAVSIINLPTVSGLNLARLVACLVWVAVPAAVMISKGVEIS